MKDELEFYLQFTDTVKVSKLTPSDLKGLIQT
ncbi:MAG TPA: ATP-binding protein, partial [Balneolaceae bacterium]|nr:ATP-binding protein [Balneolaceae bacterium]